MSMLLSKHQDVFVAIPSGRLDTNSSPEAEILLVEKIESGELKVVIDFSKTNYISSAGLRVILKTLKMLRKKGGELALCNANEQIMEVLEITGFLSMLKCLSSLEDAIREVTS